MMQKVVFLSMFTLLGWISFGTEEAQGQVICWKVTDVGDAAGTPQYRRLPGGWTFIAEGDSLCSCDSIKIVGGELVRSYVRAKRMNPPDENCKNKLEVIGSNVGTLRYGHIGTRFDGTRVLGLAFGAFDLVINDEAPVSEATIIEGQECTGSDHCGFNTAIAQAAPVDETPMGQETEFTGRYEFGASGPQVTFSLSASSSIPLGTAPLVGPNEGNIILIDPGQCITYYSDGSYDIVDNIPTLTEWGMIIFGILLLGWMAWAIQRRRVGAVIRH